MSSAQCPPDGRAPHTRSSHNCRRVTQLLCGLIAIDSAGLVGCGAEPDWSDKLPNASSAMFQTVAYPVLMRDCAFSECHGDRGRFLLIYGPGRTRLDPATSTDEPPTPAELEVSYYRAVSMLLGGNAGQVSQSPLLRKPLEIDAGGVGHHGVDDYGRNVYASQQSPGYQALLQWAQSTDTGALAPATPRTPAGAAP